MSIQIPVTTEATSTTKIFARRGSSGRIISDLDASQRDYKKLMALLQGSQVRRLNERAVEVPELSSFPGPLVDRIKTTAGDDSDHRGERVYFTLEVKGLLSYRKVSEVALRLTV